jgi:DNA-3-methyladenine glycosylase II
MSLMMMHKAALWQLLFMVNCYNIFMKKIKINKEDLRKLEKTKNPFLSLASSIISQQISLSAASSIRKRFVALFGKKKPNPKDLLKLSDNELRAAGLSRAKIIYIRDLAEKFLDKTINPKLFDKMSDEKIKEHLIQVKGIGPWTGDMFLIFALNRPDVLPVGDLGILKGFQKVFKLKKTPNVKKMHELSKPHVGRRTELSLYLWGSLETEIDL